MRTSIEPRRGCGFRKPGGLYLVSKGEAMPCCRLPFEIRPCEQCESMGLKCSLTQSRGWTTVDIDKLFGLNEPTVRLNDFGQCRMCPMAPGRTVGLGGLLWVGESFYPTPADFAKEAASMGVSKRLSAVPKELRNDDGSFRWVLLAHPKAISRPCPDLANDKCCRRGECETCGGDGVVFTPGIFYMFRPTGLEYVVTGDEDEEELEAIEKRGIEPVRVIREGETMEMSFNGQDNES